MSDWIGIALIVGFIVLGGYGCMKEKEQTERELNRQMISAGYHMNKWGNWEK